MKVAVLLLLLASALAGGQARPQGAPPAPQVYRWKDDKGKIQITNTPPPPGAVVLEAPPPPMALEADPGPKLTLRQSQVGTRSKPTDLSPSQKAAWEALDKALSEARRKGDRATLQAVATSLIRDSRWGNGLGFVAILPFVALALLSLLGWWAAFHLPRAQRLPLIGAFVFTGMVLGQLLLIHFLYRPQFFRLQVNLGLLTEHYLGGDLRLGPKNREALQAHWAALQAACAPSAAPWRFPAEVEAMEETLKRVMVEP